ncbi:MAG: glycosyltransferase [Cyclobacteriaceae bacterium]
MESVKTQSYPDIEWVVVDGLSNDRTLEIIKPNMAETDVLISEKDSGIYNAMNKGISLASGDIIGFLNSDDTLASSRTIETIVQGFKKNDVKVIYGDLAFVNSAEETVRKWEFGIQRDFVTGWHPAHPTFYAKRECYEKLGGYNEALSLSADFELMLRFLQGKRVSAKYISEILVHMRIGGATTSSLGNMWKGFLQTRKAFLLNKMKYPLLYPLYRYLPKLKSWITK